MKRFFFLLVGLLVLGTLSSLPALAQEKKKQEKQKNEEERTRVIKAMLTIVHNKKLHTTDKEKVEGAIWALGEYRAEEAIPDLVELLEFTQGEKYERFPGKPHFGFHELYPAYKALGNIGSSSAPLILKAIAEKDRSGIYLRNAKYLLLKILETRSETQKRLSEAIKEEKNEEKVKRLKAFEATFDFKPEK